MVLWFFWRTQGGCVPSPFALSADPKQPNVKTKSMSLVGVYRELPVVSLGWGDFEEGCASTKTFGEMKNGII